MAVEGGVAAGRVALPGCDEAAGRGAQRAEIGTSPLKDGLLNPGVSGAQVPMCEAVAASGPSSAHGGKRRV